MEDRIQGGLKEGAGLEESRLNTEFIDFLRKWSTPVLMVIAAVAGSYFLYGKYQVSRDAAMARAFADLDAAVVSRNPGSLIRVAEEQSGKAAVPLLARLAAADLYLESSRTGVPAGIALEPSGSLPEGTTLLTADERTAQLGKAAAEYEAVFAAAGRDDGMAIHAISALFGLASVAESRGDMAKARERYTQLIDLAKRVGFVREAAAAQKRIDTLPSLETMPRIFTQNDLYVVKSAANPIQVKTADGSVVTIDAGATTPGAAGPAAGAPGEPAPKEETPKGEPQPQPAPANPGR